MPLQLQDTMRFKERLVEIRDQLTKVLRGSTIEARMPDETRGYSQHQADEGSDDFDRSMNLQMTAKEFDMLNQVERALHKIEEGTYGVCDLSGEDIPLPRLEAVPYATMTVKAQERLEKGLL